MLGVVVALPWELKTLTRETLQPGTCRTIRDNITVALSGIGAERAYAAAALLFSRGATALLSWGCAAALDDRAPPGTVMLPEWILETNGETHRVTPAWHRELYKTLSVQHCVCVDPLVESDGLLKDPAEKQRLARRTRAIATDMEESRAGEVAREHRLPFMVVRAVLDSASTELPENIMQTLDANGKIRVRSFLSRIAVRPAEWLAFIKLAIQFRAARKTLRRSSRHVLDASQAYLNGISDDPTIASRG